MWIINKNKKLYVYALVCILLLSICVGCEKKNEDGIVATDNDSVSQNNQIAMKVAGQEVYEEETMMYCLLELLSGEISYSYVQENEDQFEAEIINYIAETKVLYNIAIEQGMDFTEEDEADRDTLIENFKSFASQDILDKYNISEEMIFDIITEYCYVQKFEYEQKMSITKELYEGYTSEYADYNFQKLYIMVFPIIEVDDNGNMMTDNNGDYVMLNNDELQVIRDDITSAIADVRSGENPEDVAVKYGVDSYSNSQMGYEGGYNEEINTAIEGLKAGECSEILEQDNCYYFVSVLSDHDDDYKDDYVYKLASNEAETKYSNDKYSWMEEKTADGSEINDNFWQEFSLEEMAKLLYEAGLIG
ncbi:MAG: peptidylprolyl isomerase [Wujia sp.]